MKLKASQDYALSMICYLARINGIASSREIAEAEAVPRDYLIQIAQELRYAGIIADKPGNHSGYLLAKPADEISVFDVLFAADQNTIDRFSGHEARKVEMLVNRTLREVSIDDLIGGCEL